MKAQSLVTLALLPSFLAMFFRSCSDPKEHTQLYIKETLILLLWIRAVPPITLKDIN